MLDAIISLFKNSLVIGVITLLAAYFAGQLLYLQRRRWLIEDARNIGVSITLSKECTKQGWFHGHWEVENRAPFPLKLLHIEVMRPRKMIIGTLDSSTQGPIEGMRVDSSGRFLTISSVVRIKDPPLIKRGYIHNWFLYKVSNTPDEDRGKTFCLRFLLCEVDSPTRRYVRDVKAVIPMNTE
jgi:hypothetical protein